MPHQSPLHAALLEAHGLDGRTLRQISEASGIPVTTLHRLLQSEPQAIRHWLALWGALGYDIKVLHKR